jgi:hypothetical protein
MQRRVSKEAHRRFGGKYCLYILGRRLRQEISNMYFYNSSTCEQRTYSSGLNMCTVRLSETSVNLTGLHGITSQKLVLFIVTAVRTHTQKTECRERSKPDQRITSSRYILCCQQTWTVLSQNPLITQRFVSRLSSSQDISLSHLIVLGAAKLRIVCALHYHRRCPSHCY